MFKVGDKVVKKDGSEWDLWKYRTVRVADEYGYIMLYGDSKIYCVEELKLYQEECNVVKCLCDGGCDLDKNYVSLSIEGNKLSVMTSVCACGSVDEEIEIKFCPMCGKELKRKEYTFEEAFKAYEEGKEIESIEGMKYRYKMEGRNDKYYSEINSSFYSNDSFDIKEIRGKWYIND